MSDQAAEQSLEDRIAGQFEDDEAQEEEVTLDEEELVAEPEADGEEAATEEPEETPEEPELVAIELPNGKEIQLQGLDSETQDMLREYVSKGGDYTQKTQKLADQRRQVEIQQAELNQLKAQQQFQQATSKEVAKIEALNEQIKKYESMDWSKMTTDEMIRHKMKVDDLDRTRREIGATLQQAAQQFEAQQKQSRAELLQKGLEALKKSIPSFTDETGKEIATYALNSGFTQEQISETLDPALVTALWKAMRYDNLQSQKGKTLTEATKALPTVRPSSSKPMPEDVKQKLNYRKAISKAKTSQDKAKVIQGRVADMF